MSTKAFVGKVRLFVGDGASPEVFAAYCEATAVTGLGVTNALVEATTLCSDGNKEYIAGLADGKEVTIEANYVQSGADATRQNALIGDVEAKTTRHFQVIFTDDSPEVTFEFALAMLGWELVPSNSDKNKVSFVGKITGPITRS